MIRCARCGCRRCDIVCIVGGTVIYLCPTCGYSPPAPIIKRGARRETFQYFSTYFPVVFQSKP